MATVKSVNNVIGVTGLPCSGKSYAAELLAAGAVAGGPGELIKADDVGHAILLRPDIQDRLRERFGDDVIAPGAAAETRRRIASRVFNNPAELEWLERLVHPLVVEEEDRAVARAAGRLVVIEAALLFAAGLERRCGRVLVVEADFATRLRRATARGWSREELERRDRRQLPLFAPDRLRDYETEIVVVRNDDDDGRLGERIAAALAHDGANGR